MTSTNKPMKKLSLESTEGVAQVNIFSDFPHYADIIVGSTIDGEIRKNDKGYNNLYSNEIKQRGGAPSAFKTAQIKEVMDVKRQDIQESQKNKEIGIKVSATMRDAVLIATALTPEQWQGTTMQEEVRFWREWLWTEWDNTGSDTMKPF